ncbi:hypothetical protein ABE65_010440 [Fictibacillus phosphorivorans]|uniref:Uncharacterized protein n=1 Tax=Fictibacillus phosphorivorans TaxID=1221500 RepID=A0A160ILN0_9BACL|nr:hypothetical protein [Fictibacillus phosphorivorans]ANC77198.1 hypothetical protein ABE65_010440 [Fictibacillus phosphorivorans]
MIKELDMVHLNLRIITKYEELDKKKRFMINKSHGGSENYNYVYQYIREEILTIYNNPQYVANVLVEYLYGIKNAKNKTTLWNSFGDVLVANLKKNLGDSILCPDCNVRFEVTKQRQAKCLSCQENTKKEKAKARKVKFKNKKMTK